MSTPPEHPRPLHGWTVLSLRPRGQHEALRDAANRRGARLMALSPFAIELLTGAAHLQTLKQALLADMLIWTSPNAVRAAAAVHPLAARRDQIWLAVGSGTRRALQRVGIAARAPVRMDSEGLLAMPELQDVRGCSIGLITAPAGRGLLAPSLAERGAVVLRADVYARRTIAINARALAALEAALAAPHHLLLALSSGEALPCLLAATSQHSALMDIAVVAASERLADVAREAGFRRITIASSAAPAALLRAAAKAFV
ncbi:MAG: uroporphyrinogen-III synthase [Thermomonas sp.]